MDQFKIQKMYLHCNIVLQLFYIVIYDIHIDKINLTKWMEHIYTYQVGEEYSSNGKLNYDMLCYLYCNIVFDESIGITWSSNVCRNLFVHRWYYVVWGKCMNRFNRHAALLCSLMTAFAHCKLYNNNNNNTAKINTMANGFWSIHIKCVHKKFIYGWCNWMLYSIYSI